MTGTQLAFGDSMKGGTHDGPSYMLIVNPM